MNPFPSCDNPYQGQSFSPNYQVITPQSYQINSNPFYYPSGSHSHPNSTASFSPPAMYNSSYFQDQIQKGITAFIPATPQKNNTGLDANGFNQLLEKIDSDIQTNNQLFRQDYLKLLKQRTTVQEKLQEINDMDNFKLKIESLENLAKSKPTLQDALLLRDRIHSAYDKTEFADINLIVQDIEACEAVTRKINDFLAKYNSKVKNYFNANPHHAREFGEITRGLNGLKKEIRLLVLKDTEALHQWDNFEWYLKVKLELVKEPGSLQLCDLEHWQELKDFASTSEILGSKQFEKICQQIHLFEEIKKRAEQIKKHENLTLPNKDNKEGLTEIRKKLAKKAEVEALLKDIKSCYISASQEKAYIEELLQSTKNITNLYIQRKSKQKKLSKAQLDQFLRLFERLPMQASEKDEINGEKQKAANIIKSIDINPTYTDLGFAKNIHEQYKNCLVDIPSAKKISDFYLKNQNNFSMQEEIPAAAQNKDSSLLGKRKGLESSDKKRSKLSTTSKSEGEISSKDSASSSPQKKIARELFHSAKENQRSMNIEQANPVKKVKNEANSMAPEFKVEISDFRRGKANTDIFNAIRNVRDLPRDKDPGVIAKNLEEKVYNRYLNNRDQYLLRVTSICTFFGDLNYSAKTQKKLFATAMEYEHIREYLGQKLEGDNSKPIITVDDKQRKIINTGKMLIENPGIQNYQPINEIMKYPDYLSVPPPLPYHIPDKKNSKFSWKPQPKPNNENQITGEKPQGLTIHKPTAK